jgi:hypothetical protein
MNNTILIYPNFIAQVSLKKRSLFGFNDIHILFLLTPSLKIIKISNPQKIKFLYNENDFLVSTNFTKWVVENGYDFKFLTKSKSLKRILILDVESYIDDLKKTDHDTEFKKLIKWFKI